MERHPARSANCLSNAFFCWLGRLLHQGRGQLNADHIYEVLPELSSHGLADQLAREWERELYKWRNRERPSLLRALRRLFAHNVVEVGAIFVIVEACRVTQAIFISLLITFFEKGVTVTSLEAYLYATGYVVAYILGSMLDNLGLHKNYCYGMQMRVATTSLVYRKLLKLNHHSMQDVNSGSIINLVASDTQAFEQCCLAISYVWIACMECVLITWLLWWYLNLGVYTMAGVAALLLAIPIQYLLGRQLTKLRLQVKPATERRLRILSEVFRGIKTIKINCWESAFSTMLTAIRTTECAYLSSMSYLHTISSSLHFTWGKLVILALFASLHFTGQSLTAGKVLTSLALLDILRGSTTLLLPWAVHYLSQAKDALQRIQEYMVLEERAVVDVQFESMAPAPPDVASETPHDLVIQLNNYSTSWSEDNNNQKTLKDVSLSVTTGQLVSIIGETGSGKSSLLLSITGELQKLTGCIYVQGSLGYVPQKPWLFPGTVQDNILFGAAWNKRLYKKVLMGCSLLQDLEKLPFGDATEMEEEELTSTQKAKIMLARSFYQNADIYLIDNIFAHMDDSSASEIFTRCLCNMLKKKTILLVTDHYSFIQASDLVVRLQQGSIQHVGTYEEVRVRKPESLLPYEDHCHEVACGMIRTLAEHKNDARVIRQKLALASHYAWEIDAQGDYSRHVQTSRGRGSPITMKLYNKARMKWSVYTHYLRAGGTSCAIITVLILSILVHILFIFCDFFMYAWLINEPQINSTNTSFHNGSDVTSALDSDAASSSRLFLYSYAGVLAVYLVLSLLAAFAFCKMTGASRLRLHTRVLSSLMGTPLSVIESITPGVIMERFARDMTFTDSSLPSTVFDCVQFGSLALGTLVLACIANYWLLLAAIALLALLLAFRHLFIQTYTKLKTLEDSARTKIYQHVTNSLEGIRSIRAFSNEDTYTRQFDSLLDHHTSVRYLLLATNRWLALRHDILGILLLAAFAYTAVAAKYSLLGDLGVLGLSYVYMATLMSYTQYAMRQSSELQSQLLGVEELVQYMYLQSEPTITGDLPSLTWPQYGIVTLEGCTVNNATSRSLRNIWCCFRAEEKVGVLSSSECSKRGLVSAILRLVQYKGTVRIDGVDTSTVPLHKLRQKIAVVNQDPAVFGGSVRRNLDPFTQYSDTVIWRALDTVRLSDKIRRLPGGLYTEMVSYGESLSCGEKQLLELARALLKTPRLLLFEESLSTFDDRTDAVIKHVLLTQFNHCTTIILAQHLQTVIDVDRVMILDDGKLKEFDPPHLLLENEDSIFHNLVHLLPEPLLSQLVQAAKDKYENRPYVAPAQSLGGELGMPHATGSTRHFLPLFQLNHLSGTPTRFTSNRLATNKF